MSSHADYESQILTHRGKNIQCGKAELNVFPKFTINFVTCRGDTNFVVL